MIGVNSDSQSYNRFSPKWIRDLVGVADVLAFLHVIIGTFSIIHVAVLLPTLVRCFLEQDEVPLSGVTDFVFGIVVSVTK